MGGNLSSWGNDMSVHAVVANGLHHGSYEILWQGDVLGKHAYKYVESQGLIVMGTL